MKTIKRLIRIIGWVVCGLLVLAAAFFTTRQALASRAIREAWETEPGAAPELATTATLEVIPLYEEAAVSPELISWHGVSYLVRTATFTLLMDVGFNPDASAPAPYARNMAALGISPDEIDAVLISHPHSDHIGGLAAWRQETVGFGQLDFLAEGVPVYVPTPMSGQDKVYETGPVALSPDTATTGVIPYPEVWPFTLFDPVGFEQAVVVNMADAGLVLVTGCGHPTVERLVERAEKLYGLPVVGVLGGMHYEGLTAADVRPHIEFLGARTPVLVAVSPHDSSPDAMDAFRSAFPQAYQEIAVGAVIHLP